jgi:cbb3-type cytochrome oxidase maturation protein
MTAIIVLIVCSLIVAGGFLAAFLFSVKNGQYDDTYTPAVRILFDENNEPEQKTVSAQPNQSVLSEHKFPRSSSEIKLQIPNSKL